MGKSYDRVLRRTWWRTRGALNDFWTIVGTGQMACLEALVVLSSPLLLFENWLTQHEGMRK